LERLKLNEDGSFLVPLVSENEGFKGGWKTYCLLGLGIVPKSGIRVEVFRKFLFPFLTITYEYKPKSWGTLVGDAVGSCTVKTPSFSKSFCKLNLISNRDVTIKGVPGAGKSSLVFALASEFNLPIYNVTLAKKG